LQNVPAFGAERLSNRKRFRRVDKKIRFFENVIVSQTIGRARLPPVFPAALPKTRSTRRFCPATSPFDSQRI
jgi:hypothetical protein